MLTATPPSTTPRTGSILIVDDEVKILKLLSRYFLREGHDVKVTADPAQALRLLRSESFDVLLLDNRMPGLSGMDLLRASRESSSPPAVIMMTAYATVPSAVEAMKMGALDYVQKPFDFDTLRAVVQSVLSQEPGVPRSPEGAAARTDWHGIVGRSRAIRDVLERLETVARTDSTVLVTGETGTGKELVARAIHRLSTRHAMPLVRVNCAAIPDGLLESEMFGHVRGAFTGATQSRRGKFASAHRGTLFLDEVSGLTLPLQQKLLRVLQEVEFEPLGSDRTFRADVRIIAATNRDLAALTVDGRFQQDLFYRLNVIPLRIPPLRARREDIPLLAETFLNRFSQRLGRRLEGFSPAAMRRLVEHDWPGNVRELENTVERATALSAGRWVDLESISDLETARAEPAPDRLDLRGNVSRFTKETILRSLRQANGRKKEAAILMGISQRALSYYLRKFGI